MQGVINRYLEKVVEVIDRNRWISGSGKYLPEICIRKFKEGKGKLLFCKVYAGNKHFFVEEVKFLDSVEPQKGFSLKTFQDREKMKEIVLRYWRKNYYWVEVEMKKTTIVEILGYLLKNYEGWFEIFIYRNKDGIITIAIKGEDLRKKEEIFIDRIIEKVI